MSKSYDFKVTCDVPIKIRVERTIRIEANTKYELRKKLEGLQGELLDAYTIIDDSNDVSERVDHNINNFEGLRLDDFIEDVMEDPQEFSK